MRLPRLLAGSAVAALLTGTAACGLQSVEPKIQLRDAARAFAEAQSGALRLSIPSSVADVRAFLEAAGSGSPDAPHIPDADLQTILSASLDVGYDYGEDPKSDADDAGRLVVHIGDLDAGELRFVDQVMYVQVDVDGLAQEFPDMQEDLDEARAGLTGGDPSAGPVPDAIREPATALLDGEWVSLDYQVLLDQLAALAGPDAGADAGLSEGSSAEGRELIGKALRDAVVSVERREADDDLGDHLVATISLRKAWTQLRSGLPALFAGKLGKQLEGSLPPVDEVPDKDVAVSFWVRDEALTRVELDAAQFLDEPTGHLVLRADVLEAQEITAPSDAVALDIEAFTSGLPLGEPETEGELDAHTVAAFVDEGIRVTAEADGVPPSVAYLPYVLPGYAGMAPGLLIAAVDQRIQVDLDGASACLTLSPDGAEGTIVDAPC